MYQNILIPVVVEHDHNNQASFEAAKVLANTDAKFTILHVLEAIPGFALSEIPADLLNKSHSEREKAVSKMADALPGSEVKIVSGHAGRTIIDYATDNGVDCIVVASHRPGIGDFFLGSTAARVVRHAKCSVHVIR